MDEMLPLQIGDEVLALGAREQLRKLKELVG